MKIFQKLIKSLQKRPMKRYSYQLAENIKTALQEIHADIPVFIISYNNAVYVQNMVKQLNQYKIKPIILDNASTDKNNLEILNTLHQNNLAYTIFSKYNYGHMVGFNDAIYHVLPNLFAYTDPDLQFHPDLPHDFLEQLAHISTLYPVYKVGCALPTIFNGKTVDDPIPPQFSKRPFTWKGQTYTLHEWEQRYWKFPLQHPHLQLYHAKIDTTFAVYRKSNYMGDFYEGIRVSGNFDTLHLPWFPEIDIMSSAEKEIYLKNNQSTTWIR